MAHKRVYLIRHGMTKGNVEKRYIGKRTDEPLSAEGIEKLTKLRERIRGGAPGRVRIFASEVLIERVASSPLRRAVETARLLFDAAEPCLIGELSEMDFGLWEGRNHSELDGDPAYQSWIDSGGREKIPGGEDPEVFLQRSFAGFLKALGDPEKEETLALVCHGGTIMAVLSRLTGGEFYSFMTDNLDGYVLELELEDEGITVISYSRLGLGDPAGPYHR